MQKQLAVPKLFLISVIVSSLVFSPFVLDFTLVSRLITFSISILIALYFLYKSDEEIKINIDIILLAYSAYIFFCSLSIFWSINKAESIFEISKLTMSFFAFLFTFFSLKKVNNFFIEKLLKFSILLFFIGMAAVFYQYFTIKNLNKESLYLITGLNGHKNLYSSFLFLNLFFLIKAFYTLPKIWRGASAVSIVLTLIFILLLKTKAVWIGLIIMGLACSVLYIYKLSKRKSKINFYLGLSLSIISANLFFLFFFQPIINKGINYNTQIKLLDKTSKAELDNERLILWSKSYQMFKKNPILGVGMGNWQINFPDQTLSGLWRAEDLNITFQRPHNDFLWVLCETGIIGFNLFLFLLLSLLLLLLQTLKSLSGYINSSFDVILCFGFIAGYFTIALFDFPKERIEHTIWINIIFGISYYYIRKYNPSHIFIEFKVIRSTYIIPFIALLTIVTIGFLRYKGEYYTRKMYDYKNSNQYIKVLAAGKSALSFAYTIDPTSIPINWYTGNARVKLGDYQHAQNDFILAYGYNPFNRNVVNDLASLFASTAKIDLAKKYYIETARISPRFDDPKLNLTAIYINENNFKMADECLKSILHDSERRTSYQKMVDAFKTNELKK